LTEGVTKRCKWRVRRGSRRPVSDSRTRFEESRRPGARLPWGKLAFVCGPDKDQKLGYDSTRADQKRRPRCRL